MRNAWRIAVVAGLVAVAVAAFFLLRPSDDSGLPTGTASFEIDVPEGGPSSIEKLSVRENQHVVITVTAADEGVLHLHGYNLIRKIGPNQPPAVLDFEATKAGVFVLEDHGIDQQIAELTVEP
jgi:hypothetical protein